MGNNTSNSGSENRARRSSQPSYPPAQTIGSSQMGGYNSYPQGGSYAQTNGQMYGGHPPTSGNPRYSYQPQRQYPNSTTRSTASGSSSQQHTQQQAPTQEYQKTETIRNQVNLKKDTLKLEEAGSNKVCVAFNFDASSPCRATVFIIASEDPKNGCKITCNQGGSVSPPMKFDKGFNIKYTSSVTIDKSQLATMASQVEPSTSFNLIVRLEALTDEARSEGRSLDLLEPGCSLSAWVQAQSTFAKVDVSDDGGWMLRVQKQKIWFKGSAYELQEIYGMEQGQVQNLADGMISNIDGCECVICMSNPRDTTALPCRHMCMCHECASALKMQTNKCPICRNEIESLLHIKVAKGLPVAAS